MFKRNRFANMPADVRGATLLDVLLAILIFTVGMLALASMQGNLTRSSTDAKARTVGTNIAEEIIEGVRTFNAIRNDACPTTLAAIIAESAYQCVTSVAGTTITRAGLDYQVDVTVDDYYLYFNEDGDTLATKDTGDLPENRDTAISDFKYVEINVNWGGSAAEFVTYNEQNPTDDLGSGSFTLSSIVPSTPPLGPAKVAAAEEDAGTPPVSYSPGRRPKTIAIDLNGSKFKESPRDPEFNTIEGKGGSMETWFDVVTYNQGENTIYQRREEFLVVSCLCSLQNATPGTLTGFLPTVWNGVEYVTGNDGKMVSKAYGVPTGNGNSQYCETCCRDHHDPDKSNPDDDELYDPASGVPKWSESGGKAQDYDHLHYSRGKQDDTNLVIANPGQDYVEACRMVRKDGFMRVAQDFRQEGFLAFPGGYLDKLNNALLYSDYVTGVVADFFQSEQDMVSPPCEAGYDFEGDMTRLECANALLDVTDTTTLPLDGLDQQQMRSRGLYIDNQSEGLVDLLDCVKDKDLTMSDPLVWNACGAPGIDDPLQALPFFEVDTTVLSSWILDPQGDPVNWVFKGPKGLAELTNDLAMETVDVTTDMHRGNVGMLAAFSPITTKDTTEPGAQTVAHLFIDVGGGDDGIPPPVTSYTWTSEFSSTVNQVEAFEATIDPLGNEYCAKHDLDKLTCTTPLYTDGSIKIIGYRALSKGSNPAFIPLWVCLENAPGGMTVSNDLSDYSNNSAIISWTPVADGATGFTIVIQDTDCS